MDENVLLGLLYCKTNDVMNKSLLLAIVNSKKKGKRKVMVVSGWRLIEWGRTAFIGGRILWIALGIGVGCLWAGECLLHDACGCAWCFQGLLDAGGGEEIRFVGSREAKLGLGFICVYAVVVSSKVGANSMVLVWDGYG